VIWEITRQPPVVRLPGISLRCQALMTILSDAVDMLLLDPQRSLASQQHSPWSDRIRRLILVMLIRWIKADEACIFSLGDSVRP